MVRFRAFSCDVINLFHRFDGPLSDIQTLMTAHRLLFAVNRSLFTEYLFEGRGIEDAVGPQL